MTMVERIRQANQPRLPESSIRLRVACTLAVLAGIAAAAAEREMSGGRALTAGSLLVAGMTFSYRTRERPPAWIKVIVAVAAVSVLAWFFQQLTSKAVTDITTVEDPLTVMFIAIQVVHSFHVPSRRDLVFSIGGSAGLIAVAAAQAIDLRFAWYAVAWLACTLWALVELWRSSSGGALVSKRALAAVLGGLSLAAGGVFVLLPAPTVAVRISFLSRPGNAGPVSVPGALAGDSGKASQLYRPGSPAGASRVGGYLGFADRLDTALRGKLGRTLVMRVRAERPSYWIGETFDTWDGQSWSAANAAATHALNQGSPFDVPLPAGDSPVGESDLQTFYIATSTPDLVFHADSARQLWFPATNVFYGDDGTIVSPIGLGKGAVYTVESEVATASPAQLRTGVSEPLPADVVTDYTQLPHAYPAAATLARSVTAGASTTYDKVQALIDWIGAHTQYSTDIPALPPGADTVDDFLFGSRVGFCEQISTSLAVMLRTLGIPAREAVGYVPGRYDPITDLYEVRAEDAHAWVQVWMPGYGWQSFDPTAVVPLANPSPGGTALTDLGHALSRVPPAPIGVGVGAALIVMLALRQRRKKPATWAEAITHQMESAGRRVQRPRQAAETLFEYAAALDHEADGADGGRWSRLATDVARHFYGNDPTSSEDQHRLVAQARHLRKTTPRPKATRRRPRSVLRSGPD